MQNSNRKEQKVYEILKNPAWYSYSTKAVRKLCEIDTRQDLRTMAEALGKRVADPINFFTFNGIEYMGFETRRLDYERDKRAGTNPIEKWIAMGVYDKRR